ncbi:MAG: hypothetical protein JXR81_01360 [Candidatus Goldbacteria bacterium]|nr:hypothetical protein [Candidatus Goldiibacteriota bacterium]
MKFRQMFLNQMETVRKFDIHGPDNILSEVHNYLCRMSRPYPDYKRHGITIVQLKVGDKKNFFRYKRDKFDYSFSFESASDGYIYLAELSIKEHDGKFSIVEE